ncbi:hypothetical protein BDK51DRAFT_25910 [Blyttiomyces helicus]|uniref:RlpA-like double-psi beta-barrel-protein domain-containing protein-containing protein n=1 Tax=Blyttiomyces helicus TaxID=388810 RepID=A0A4P9VYG4_9FUNG|nr:hypothetical protein BDK51DRAFT_25910 [Blyttiomyces helicus]|eukprot:RKO82826.1 hypothetical protein BDK51DRAFT_25910 [Blyttiomyces helicus]
MHLNHLIVSLALLSACTLARPVTRVSTTSKATSNISRRDESGVGRLTYYGVDGDPSPQESLGSCGIPLNQVSGNFAAMNQDQMQDSFCGTCVEISLNGLSTIVQIVDTCPGCPLGALDININSFGDLVGGVGQARQLGVVDGASWQMVDCNGGSGGGNNGSNGKGSSNGGNGGIAHDLHPSPLPCSHLPGARSLVPLQLPL